MSNVKKIIESADNAYSAAQYEKALKLYKQALVLSPRNEHVKQYLQKTEEIKKMIKSADNAYYELEYEKAIALYKQALVLSPENKHAQQCLQKTEELKKWIEEADNAYYAAEYDKAILLYKQILDLDVNNSYVQEKLRKSERNRLSKNINPEAVPTEALQLYMRSRSFIAAGDWTLARKLLRQAIDVAEESGAHFTNAQYLLGNIQNVLKAEELKSKALNEIDAGQWARAVHDLNSAFLFDPTDDAAGTLLSHLRGLLKARSLLDRLEADFEKTRKRSEMTKEIREIVYLTNETTTLSTLWQEIVRRFGEYNNKNMVFRNRNMVVRWLMLVILSTSVMLLIIFWGTYLYPRHRSVDVNCDSIMPGLRAELDYPYYVANKDEDKIEITFINDGNSIIDDIPVEVKFIGTANLKYIDKLHSNEIELNDINPDRSQPTTIPFIVDGTTSTVSGPWYISFRVGTCTPKDLHIAMVPIQGLNRFFGILWGAIGLALIGLFNDRIKVAFEWIWSFMKKNST